MNNYEQIANTLTRYGNLCGSLAELIKEWQSKMTVLQEVVVTNSGADHNDFMMQGKLSQLHDCIGQLSLSIHEALGK